MRIFKQLFKIALAAIIAASPLYTAEAGDKEGETRYTQVNMYSLKGKQLTWVNYKVDTLIPVNTEVLVKTSRWAGASIIIKATGQKLEFKNRERHSGLTDEAWAAKHFGSHKVDLSQFAKLEREAINLAQVEIGMSKKAVIVARGYPPAHRTPSLEAPEWLYWQNRWNKKAVRFDSNGKVSGFRE